MNLSTFIAENIDILLRDWDDFFESRFQDVANKKLLRDHAEMVLLDIASHLESHSEQYDTSTDIQIRIHEGFSLHDILAKYRILRASVLQNWNNNFPTNNESNLNDIIQFNKAIDHFLNEAMVGYSLLGEQNVAKRQIFEEQIWHTAHYDDLTGLPNRRLLRDRLTQAINHVKRERSVFALLSIDLDKFKRINDRLGHAVGDLILQQASDRIRKCLREVDTVARIGGDEFTVILTNISNANNAELVSDKILKELMRPFYVDKRRLCISGSIGIALCPFDGIESEVLFNKADKAMYIAKKAGRNRYGFYEEPLISNL